MLVCPASPQHTYEVENVRFFLTFLPPLCMHFRRRATQLGVWTCVAVTLYVLTKWVGMHRGGVSEATMHMQTSAPADLDAYLRWAKAQVAHEPLTLIMGNEAGDLDSAASAIALSYILNHNERYFREKYGLEHSTYVPLIQTPRAELHFRQENLLVYRAAHTSEEALLCVDDDEVKAHRARAKLGLVDHPQLAVSWGNRSVDIIVDHHEDEGAHPEAKLRILRSPSKDPVGSASSLVALLAAESRHGGVLPEQLADLLLSAIVLDTRNVRHTHTHTHPLTHRAAQDAA